MGTESIIDMESRIIEAAKVVFVRKGYEETKMGDIAAEVGMSRTALLYYFHTKEVLFDAIFQQLMSGLLPNVALIVEEQTSCLEKIPKIVDQYISMLQRNPFLPLFIVSEFNRDPKHLYKTLLKNSQRIEPLLRMEALMEGEMERGTLRRMPFLYIASSLVSLAVFPMLIRNPLTDAFLGGNPQKFDAFIEERKPFVADVMVRMLTPESGTENRNS